MRSAVAGSTAVVPERRSNMRAGAFLDGAGARVAQGAWRSRDRRQLAVAAPRIARCGRTCMGRPSCQAEAAICPGSRPNGLRVKLLPEDLRNGAMTVAG